MRDIKKFITVKQFADAASVTRQAVNKMIKEKKLKPIMFGKTYLIEKDELQNYLKSKGGHYHGK